MSVVVRGAKNAFRNWLRTGAVVIILAIGIGLSLSMLVARQAVEARIAELKENLGTTLLVHPAGSRGFEGGGEPLTTEQVTALQSLAHVKAVDATLSFTLTNENSPNQNFMFRGPGGASASTGKTNLSSSIDAGSLGRRFAGGGETTQMPQNISLPIRGLGLDGTTTAEGTKLTITEGRALTTSDTDKALVGKDLAAKNNLKLDSTFTAYGRTFTVVGIFDQGTKFENDVVAIPLAQAQSLGNQAGQVGSIVVTVDSIENLASVQQAIKDKLGTDKADVTSTDGTAQTAIDSLQSVQQVTLIGFVASLAAAAIITLLIMTVIVRERRREIGVLKAIGGSNRTIVAQFVVEALVLVVMGAIVGLGVALVSSNGIANALVKNSTSENTNAPTREGSMSRGAMRTFRFDGRGVQDTANLVNEVTTSVGPLTILWGLLAAIGIAIVGSAVPAWFIAKVRPAIVLRGE